ncbi:MAG: hypothetical protein EKK64_06545 [Neisseriaceae bacterium]|jgi:hypothetical protein|nr:MAG: hypothetical protein EKK64_06545 [Neisseriaceae bacterium]
MNIVFAFSTPFFANLPASGKDSVRKEWHYSYIIKGNERAGWQSITTFESPEEFMREQFGENHGRQLMIVAS